MTSNDQPLEPRQIGRRELIRNGSIVLSLSALLAACGADRGGNDAPGRLGYAEKPATESGDQTVDDAVILRTLQSLEYAVIDGYEQLLGMGAFAGFENGVKRFIADHQEHATSMNDLITAAGGEPYECSNPFFVARAVEPTIEAAQESDDIGRDALNTAHSFESLLGASYQALVPLLTDGAARSAAMGVGDQEHRHAAVAALQINPDPYNPELVGQEAPDPGEFGMPFAIPSVFAPLTGITLVVGKPGGEEQKRTAITLQTPADNTFVYKDLSC